MSCEKVLCFKKELLLNKGLIDSYQLKLGKNDLAKLLNLSDAELIEKEKAEYDFNYLQLIPYCLIEFNKKYLIYNRNGSESRLNGKYSCGIGGHISEIDTYDQTTLWNVILSSIKRELLEELHYKVEYKPKFHGLIYEDLSQVGLVHLGLVFSVIVSDPQKLQFSQEIQNFYWANADEVKSPKYELWSELAIKLRS